MKKYIFFLAITFVALSAFAEASSFPFLFDVGGSALGGGLISDGKATKFQASSNYTICDTSAVISQTNATSTYSLTIYQGNTDVPDGGALFATANATGTAWTSWNEPGVNKGELLFHFASCFTLTGGQTYWVILTSGDATGKQVATYFSYRTGETAGSNSSGWNITQNGGIYFIFYGTSNNPSVSWLSPITGTHVSSSFTAAGSFSLPSSYCKSDLDASGTLVCFASTYFHFTGAAIDASGTIPVWDTEGIGYSYPSGNSSELVKLPGGTYNGYFCLRNGFDTVACSASSTIVVESPLTRLDIPPTRYDNSAQVFRRLTEINDQYSCVAETFFSSQGLLCTIKNTIAALFQPNDGAVQFAVDRFSDVKNVFPLSTIFGAITTVQTQLNNINSSSTPPALVVATYGGTTLISFGNSEVSTHFGASLYNFLWDIQDKFYWLAVTLAALGTIVSIL